MLAEPRRSGAAGSEGLPRDANSSHISSTERPGTGSLRAPRPLTATASIGQELLGRIRRGGQRLGYGWLYLRSWTTTFIECSTRVAELLQPQHDLSLQVVEQASTFGPAGVA
jgi:hypothetical protein